MHFAAANGALPALELLFAHGASVDAAKARAIEGASCAFRSDACAGAHRQNGWTPLMRAAARGHTGVAAYLIDKGAALEAKDKVRAASACTSLLW
jgi:ankyrin repeat protein